tara:strand:+ start:205 stop:447 length:243 start_codon:yes stop_codon:yes gene_type:complete
MKVRADTFADELVKYAANLSVSGARGRRKGQVAAGISQPKTEPGGAQAPVVGGKVSKKNLKSLLKKGNIPVWGSPVKAVV